MDALTIRPKQPADRESVRDLLSRTWGSEMIACLSGLHDATLLDGYIAQLGTPPDSEIVGLVTYRVADGDCEIVTLDSLRPGLGIGTRLVESVATVARSQGCTRVWLTTTNDNLPALRYYQRHGWDLVALHRDAVTTARNTVKPEISLHGRDGIPLRHALELEFRL